MFEWILSLDVNGLVIGALLGLLVGLLAAVLAWGAGARRGRAEGARETAAVRSELEASATALAAAQSEAATLDDELNGAKRDLAVLQTRMEAQTTSFEREKSALEASEKRLGQQFERLAGRVFEERTEKFSEVSEKQLESLLKPLSKDLESFRGQVEQTQKREIEQHAALRERLKQLEGLNERLNEEARNLTRALTTQVKAQGGWGEQQLEKLLELSGLSKGEHYHTQVSMTGRHGERLIPDFVLRLPEGRSIIMDSKVSLTAWTRLQAATEEDERERQLSDHVKSIRAHIDKLSDKNYADVEGLNALDFVLMFVPIESALIAALHQDPGLPEYALRRRVALLSPANFLATVRTVASVWMVHKQNTNARDIADRAGLLFDKFVGFTDNLKQVGERLRQARRAYDSALGQLVDGPGNLVGQAEKLRQLGAKHQKQLDEGLVERAEDKRLKLVASRKAEGTDDGAGDEGGEGGVSPGAGENDSG